MSGYAARYAGANPLQDWENEPSRTLCITHNREFALLGAYSARGYAA
jgi:hypothetical protein